VVTVIRIKRLLTYQGGKSVQIVSTLLGPEENVIEDGLTMLHQEVVVIKKL
jgi:hypothetical protein